MIGLLALALTIAPGQEVTDQEVIDFERFQLFNNCDPMHLMVLDTFDNEDAENIELTMEHVRFAVESRLRGARVFKAGGGLPFLEVGVNVMTGAFAITLEYNKRLFDDASGTDGFASSWSEVMFGTPGGSGADFIVSSLSRLLDKFLTEYLRVNESACTGIPQPPTQ